MAKNANTLRNSSRAGSPNGSNVSVKLVSAGAYHTAYIKLNAVTVTMVKNGTSTAGGGTKIWDFPEGLILPLAASSDLTVTGTGTKSYLASLGTVAAGTDGSLSSTEANFAPSTAASTTSGSGTCKMKSTASAPTAGAPIDGTATAVDLYLNSALNADGTGAETLTYSGTITLVFINVGDN